VQSLSERGGKKEARTEVGRPKTRSPSQQTGEEAKARRRKPTPDDGLRGLCSEGDVAYLSKRAMVGPKKKPM